MKPTSPAVAFLALAALIACLYAWLQFNDSDPTPAQVSAPARPGGSGATEPSAPSSNEASAAGPEAIDEVAPGATTRSETPRIERVEGESVTLRGTVAIPAGLPIDEQLEVLVFKGAGDPQQLALDTPEHELDALERLVARAPVEAQGRFAVQAPAEGEAWVALRARYCFSRHGVELGANRSVDEVRLEALLGAWVVGRLVVPNDASAAQRDLAKCDLTLQFDALQLANVARAASANRPREHVTRPAPSLEFEFRGVDTQSDYDLRLRPELLAAHKSERFSVAAGVRTTLDVRLVNGGELRGKVVDEDGKPIAGAELVARIDPEMFGQGGFKVRTTKSESNGGFVLAHLPAGPTQLRVKADGRLESDATATIVDGELAPELTIEMRSGASIAGRLTWADGRVAPDVEVHVGFDVTALGGMGAFNAMQGAEGKATTDAEGRFRVTGLGKGPFTVRALATPGGKTAQRDDTEAWSARADHVAPGAEDVELVLNAPLSVTGIVRNTREEPLTNFVVSARQQTGGPIPGMGGERRKKKVADSADGSFELGGLSLGEWLIDVAAEGYPRSAPIEVKISAESPPAPLEIVLQRGGVIRGVVRDPSGAPVANAEVTLKLNMAEMMRNVRIEEEEGGLSLPSALSDSQGRFSLSGLEAGPRVIVARRHDFAESEPYTAEVEPESDLTEVVLVLRRGGRILGKVFNSKGEPATGSTIQVQSGADPLNQNFAKSDSRGEFVVAHLPAGDWNVVHMPRQSGQMRGQDAEADVMSMLGDLQMSSVRVVDGEDVEVVLGAPPKDPVTLFGEVRHGGAPVAGAFIVLMADGSGGMEAMKFVRSDGAGQYRTELRQPGRYMLTIQKLGEAAEQQTVSRSVDVPQTREHRFDIDLPGGGVRGRVLQPDGQPAAKARVTLFIDGPVKNSTMFGEHYSEITTDTDGRYALDWLKPGEYTVAVGGAPFGGMFGEGTSTSGRQLRSGVVVRENEIVEGIDFKLRKPGKVTGVVRAADGAPASGATIFLRDEQGRSLERFSMIVTDAAGKFVYDGLEPGAYSVLARTASEASADSAPVRVRDGEVGEVALSLAPATMLLVSLSNDEGELLECSVEVLDDQGRQVNGMVSMAAIMEAFQKGLFSSREQRVGPLAPGRYRVIVRGPDGKAINKPVTLTGQPERKLNVRL